MYRHGFGVEQDFIQAMEFYEQASEQRKVSGQSIKDKQCTWTCLSFWSHSFVDFGVVERPIFHYHISIHPI